MSQFDVYIYGMTVSMIDKLKADSPAADTYQEIEQTFIVPGSEAANCAAVLGNLGVGFVLDGCHLGFETQEAMPTYLEARGVDCSKLTTVDYFPS